MKVQTVFRKPRRFYFAKLDCLVRVENRLSRIVIRASKDNFSERQKAFFIRHLAAEGFIPDAYQRFSECRFDPSLPAKWLIDRSWLETDRTIRDRAPGQVLRTIFVGTLVWFLAMLPVLLKLH